MPSVPMPMRALDVKDHVNVNVNEKFERKHDSVERQNLSFKRPRTDFNHARLCSLVTLGPSECHWRNSSPHWREFHLPENMKMGKIQPIISGSWYLVKRPK